MRAEDQRKFCEENFLNFRALNQADNIKNQLYEILSNARIEVCRNFFRGDVNYVNFMEMK